MNESRSTILGLQEIQTQYLFNSESHVNVRYIPYLLSKKSCEI